jgi:acyl-coenzyme A thioesterase PaaI-like protein
MPADPDAPPSLQLRHAPLSTCFGCGPANPAGLHLASQRSGDGLVATWTPGRVHEAFPGVVSGGILGALLDCHANWTAAVHLMERHGADRPAPTVTADLELRFRRPTPSDGPLHLSARVVEASDSRAVVTAEVMVDGVVTASSRGTFVAVGPGHPAYDRWSGVPLAVDSSASTSEATAPGR